MVLNALMEEPYEPLHKAEPRASLLKTLFLVAICSGARASELTALDARPEMLVIRRGYASLKANPAFQPKVASEANINREIVLEAFMPDYDKDSRFETQFLSLCPVKALRWYQARMGESRRPGIHQPFVSRAKGMEGNPVAHPTVSNWLVEVIQLAYRRYGIEPPKVRAHSTRAVTTLFANLRGASVEDVCRAATGSSSSAFAKH